VTSITASGISSGAGSVIDPYDSPAERAEGCFVGTIVSGILAKFGLIDVNGFCSTYREWHIFQAGIWAGFRAGQLADIPECPEYWQDEAQYYHGGAMLANVAKIYGTSGLATLGGVVLWANQSEILPLIKALIAGIV
jgi:hypothetical protein